MSETTISPINGPQPVDHGTTGKTQNSATPESEAAQKTASPDQTVPQKQKEDQPALANSLADVSIHFRIDEKTRDLTVFIVDRKTKRILRSIPPSEVHNLRAGDLLKLTA